MGIAHVTLVLGYFHAVADENMGSCFDPGWTGCHAVILEEFFHPLLGNMRDSNKVGIMSQEKLATVIDSLG
jgi:hypothetical protein